MMWTSKKRKIMKRRIGTIILVAVLQFFFLPVFHDYCQAAISPERSTRPKIGLVLSGGGARGAAHIGVIKALEELHIPIDYITGTSMGSIVGGLYASGMTTVELEEALGSIDWSDAFRDDIPRSDRSFRRKTDDKTYLIQSKPGLSDDLKIKLPSGLVQGQKIDLIFKRLCLPVSEVKDFDNFRIPFRAVATDIVTGKGEVLGTGDLAMVMRASMSVPGVFAPVEIDGKLLVDGGVSNNLPIDVAREMGADIIIAVDISTPLLGRDELDSSLKITRQLTGILTRRNTELQISTLTDMDVLLVPDLADISSAAFNRTNDAIAIGFRAADEKKQELLHLALPKPDYEMYLAGAVQQLKERQAEPPVIDFVELDNDSRISDKVLLEQLKIETGRPLDVTELEKDIGQIYGLELFQTITYEIIEEDNRTGLVIHVKERSWGPNYIQLGMTLSGDPKGDSFYNLGMAYTRTTINKLGGEFRIALQVGNAPAIFAEIYQPLDYKYRYFVNPRLFWGRKNINIFSENGEIISEYNVKRYGVDFAVGRELGTWGETRIGIIRMKGRAEVWKGMATLPDYDYDSGELYLKLAADKLDNRNFPRKGYSGSMEYISSLEDIGADTSFDQVLLKSQIAKSWERNTLIGSVLFYSTVDSDAPIQNLFQLGGLFNLSGYQEDELTGQHMGLLMLRYMHRIGDFNLMPTYIGASLEYGNVWQNEDDIDFANLIAAGSLFVGVDSFLGPIYLGYGQAEGNINSFYFYLGKVF
jgi:NTE family protein